MSASVQEALDRASVFGQRLEDLFVAKGPFTIRDAVGRDQLLLAYWSLVLEYHKRILALFVHKFYAGAFALLRVIIEAQLRALVVFTGSDGRVAQIKAGNYVVNFKTIGDEIDAKLFGKVEPFFGPFLKITRDALHDYTHSGFAQLRRRFSGTDLGANYSDKEIIDVIQLSTTATWLVTLVTLGHFDHGEAAKSSYECFMEWRTNWHVTGVNTLASHVGKPPRRPRGS